MACALTASPPGAQGLPTCSLDPGSVGHCNERNRKCGINRPNNREQRFRECRSIGMENALDWGKHCVRGRHPSWLPESTSPVASNDCAFYGKSS
jgi:hypothetical protein